MLCHGENKSTDHVILRCPLVDSFWSSVGGTMAEIVPACDLWSSRFPGNMKAQISSTFLLPCSWELWKHMNDIVFWGSSAAVRSLLQISPQAVDSQQLE